MPLPIADDRIRHDVSIPLPPYKEIDMKVVALLPCFQKSVAQGVMSHPRHPLYLLKVE